MAAFTPIDVNNPQREIIYDQLKRAILNGDIKPNERIVETKYAKLFHVSRTPVREAIRMLEKDELVVYEPQKGAIARSLLSEKELEEVYLIRSTLQMLSAESVIKNITDEELQAMEKHNAACLDALETGDIEAYFYNLDQFNDILVASSRMPLLIKLINQIEIYNPGTTFVDISNSAHLREYAVPTSRRFAAVEEHISLTKALREKDVEGFKALLRIHTINVKKAALQNYKEHHEKLMENA